MSFSKGVPLAEIFKIQILGFFNRIGPKPTFDEVGYTALRSAIAVIREVTLREAFPTNAKSFMTARDAGRQA